MIPRSAAQQSGLPSRLHAARQPRAADAWKQFAYELRRTLAGLEEDAFLIIAIKRSNRFVQFAGQGSFGMRVEATSNFYLPEPEQLSETQHDLLLDLGWQAPTNLPDDFGYKADGSPNYFVDLAHPVPFDDVATLAISTLVSVDGADHPGFLEYTAISNSGKTISFPNLGLRQVVLKT